MKRALSISFLNIAERWISALAPPALLDKTEIPDRNRSLYIIRTYRALKLKSTHRAVKSVNSERARVAFPPISETCYQRRTLSLLS